MAGKFGMKDGTEYLPEYNWTPGMNDDLAYADRAGWETSVAMLTGGVPQDWDMFGGPEVGNQYDLDPMSEARTMTTFSESDPKALDHIGMAAAEGATGMQENAAYVTLTGPGGKKSATAPQNYTNVGRMKKA